MPFESSLTSITVDDAESGTATTTLTWNTTGMTDDYRLTLHTYLLDGWKLVFPAESVPLEVNGTRVVTIQSSLTFSPPTYLLSIVGAKSNAIIDQRIVTIPYAHPIRRRVPPIEHFHDERHKHRRGADWRPASAQVTVSWSVANRVPTANLVFEQVMKDGQAISVELPRPYVWVPVDCRGAAHAGLSRGRGRSDAAAARGGRGLRRHLRRRDAWRCRW